MDTLPVVILILSGTHMSIEVSQYDILFPSWYLIQNLQEVIEELCSARNKCWCIAGYHMQLA